MAAAAPTTTRAKPKTSQNRSGGRTKGDSREASGGGASVRVPPRDGKGAVVTRASWSSAKSVDGARSAVASAAADLLRKSGGGGFSSSAAASGASSRVAADTAAARAVAVPSSVPSDGEEKEREAADRRRREAAALRKKAAALDKKNREKLKIRSAKRR